MSRTTSSEATNIIVNQSLFDEMMEMPTLVPFTSINNNNQTSFNNISPFVTSSYGITTPPSSLRSNTIINNPWASSEGRECLVRSSIKRRSSSNYGDHEDDDDEGVLGVSTMKMKMKRSISSMKGRRKVREPRFCFKTMSDVDVLDDGYKWRKYGQKVVKNTLHPRSYYRCTEEKCRVKKRVERLGEDPRMVITTYEGRHAHSPSNHNLHEDHHHHSLHFTNFFS